MIRDIPQLSALEKECNFCFETCNVCQRSGLPILLLRRALVPKEPVWPNLATEVPDTQMGLRILRAGYLYVLLDQRVWQAYEVMPDGYLRQIDPYHRRVANDTLLSASCIYDDHDIPASFLNIDTERYTIADIAFSADPWPKSVLDAYKAGTGFTRLQRLDLDTARHDPAAIGLAMTAEQPLVFDHVYEYSDFVPGFNSVHGFHSRAARRMPLRQYLRDSTQIHGLAQGLAAVIIDDSVGLVQEYNGLRASWAHARQVWLEEPERAYQQQTSQILLTIRELNRQWAEPKVPRNRPMSKQPYPHIVPWATERQRLVDAVVTESNERLEKRYDEPRRAAFQAAYDQQLQGYQQHIDRYAALYADAVNSQRFALIQRHDYAANDLTSAIAYAKMLSSCLRGGISEAAGNDDGPTAQLWLTLLQDHKGPVYQALLMRDQNVLAGLLPIFEMDGTINWQDSGRFYTLLTKALLSKEVETLRRAHLQEAIAQLLASMNSAGARLKNILGPGVELVISRLNSASQLVYNGVHLTELRVQMKLSEYYALQSAHIRGLQHKLANGVDRAVRQTRQKIEPMMMGGVLSLSVLEPKLAHLVVGVSVWVEGTLEDLKNSLSQDAKSANSHGLVSSRELLPVTVGIGTLDVQTSRLLQGFKVSSELAGRWVRGGFGGLRGMVGSAELLMSVGSLYLLSDSLLKNINAAHEAVGEGSLDATLAMQGSALGVIGGGIELVGVTLSAGSLHMLKHGHSAETSIAATRFAADAGAALVKTGAIIIAISGLYDAVLAGLASRQASRAGDQSAFRGYVGSAALYGLGSLLGAYGAAVGSLALIGPMGLAIILGLAGYALFKYSTGLESSALETWARRCHFGHANESPKIHWLHSSQAATALGELNAATLGLSASVDRRTQIVDGKTVRIGEIGTLQLPKLEPEFEYYATLPYFNPFRSGYWWSVTAFHSNTAVADDTELGKVIVSGIYNAPTAANPEIVDYTSRIAVDDYLLGPMPLPRFESRLLPDGTNATIVHIHGTFQLIKQSGIYNIKSVRFKIFYWPDHDNIDHHAGMVRNRKLDD